MLVSLVSLKWIFLGYRDIFDPTPRICLGGNESVCVEESFYVDTTYLPFDPRGYKVFYERCCRNRTLVNVISPLSTGAVYDVTITAENMLQCNSNPIFDQFPGLYACVNEVFEFDFTATDPDGDSLVYELCAPYHGGTIDKPKPRPKGPPYDFVDWMPPYNLNNLLGGTPLTIDSRTGKITAIPSIIGQFLVGVCVKEYRNGVQIGYTRRDWELNIVPCGEPPVGAFERAGDKCDGLTVSFTNNSAPLTHSRWYFNFPDTTTLKSTDFSPTVTFPDTGEYEVVLVAFNDACFDTVRKKVRVLDPQLDPDFVAEIDCQGGINLTLIDTSTSRNPIIDYQWRVALGANVQTGSGKRTVFQFPSGGDFEVRLTIMDIDSCEAIITRTVRAKTVEVDLIPDTTICLGESVRLVQNPDPQLKYRWDPLTGLDTTISSNPLAMPDQTTSYSVTISDGACTVERSVTVTVRGLVNLTVTGDTMTCDGTVKLTASSDSTQVFEWSFNSNFNPIIYRGAMLETTITGDAIIYVRAGSDDQCQNVVAWLVKDRRIDVSFDRSIEICTGDTTKLVITNNDPNAILDWEFEDNPIIISGSETNMPVILIDSAGTYFIRFTVKNQYGCELTDSIEIKASLPPVPDFTLDYNCGSLMVMVSTQNDGAISWDFGDGKGQSNEKTVKYTYDKSGRYRITLTVDKVCSRSISKDVTVVFIEPMLMDTVISCFAEDVHLNPRNDTSYRYEWTPATGLDDPNSSNPLYSGGKDQKFAVRIYDPNFPECDIMDTVCVIVPPVINMKLDSDTLVCEPGELTFKASSGFADVTYLWCDEQGNVIGNGLELKIFIDRKRVICLKGTDRYGCETQLCQTVDFYEYPMEIEGPDNLCFGDSAFVKIRSGNDVMIEWEPNDGSIIKITGDTCILVKPTVSTNYRAKITHSSGCVWYREHRIAVHNPGLSLDAKAEPDRIVVGLVSQLEATLNSNWVYKWSPNDGSLNNSDIYNPEARPEKTTTYTVKVTDEFGCMATDTVTVRVVDCAESIFIPNAFSPNGDSKNDVLYVRAPANFVQSIELIVYNRWGEEVFQTQDINVGWQGDFNGENLSPDVYGYHLKFRCFEDRDFSKTGNVTLMK